MFGRWDVGNSVVMEEGRLDTRGSWLVIRLRSLLAWTALGREVRCVSMEITHYWDGLRNIDSVKEVENDPRISIKQRTSCDKFGS